MYSVLQSNPSYGSLADFVANMPLLSNSFDPSEVDLEQEYWECNTPSKVAGTQCVFNPPATIDALVAPPMQAAPVGPVPAAPVPAAPAVR